LSMTKLPYTATVLARLLLLGIGYILLAAMFVLQIVGQIGDAYYAAFIRFASDTKTLLTRYSEIK